MTAQETNYGLDGLEGGEGVSWGDPDAACSCG